MCQDMDVSPAIGCPYPEYLFGLESDVSPAIGVRVPCLPFCACVCFGVREPNYGSSDSHSR